MICPEFLFESLADGKGWIDGSGCTGDTGQNGRAGEPVSAQAFKQGMECRTVVMVAEMTEFMEHDIVPQMLRHEHEAQIEVDIVFGGTASPVGTVVLYGKPVIFEPVSGSQSSESPGEIFPGLASERFRLLRRNGSGRSEGRLLPCHHRQHPLFLRQQEADSGRIRDKVRHGDRHPAHGMHPHRHPSAPGIPAQDNIPDVIVPVYLFFHSAGKIRNTLCIYKF